MTNRKRTVYSVKMLRAAAQKRGGNCLSKTVSKAQDKIKWQCKDGHIWRSQAFSVVRGGAWCPKCSLEVRAAKRRLGIDIFRKLANKKGGKLISNAYKNSHEKLIWQCKKGHEWEASPSNIKAGKWCPYCSGHKIPPLDDLQVWAKKLGGKLISKSVRRSTEKLEWQCKEGHTFKAIYNSVKKGHWCPVCWEGRKGKTLRNDLSKYHQVAKERGGKYLENDWKPLKQKHRWVCHLGHEWAAQPSNVLNGNWCPECSGGLGERITRKIFEGLFNAKFERIKPKWLVNDRGGIMEFDGFNEHLKLAFEHHGLQHYGAGNFFLVGKKAKGQRVKDDRRKAVLAKKNGIVLIEVPEIPRLLKLDAAQSYIVRECRKNGINISNKTANKQINIYEAYQPDELKRIRELARAKGGKCLSEFYVNNSTKLNFQCNYGHTWETAPQNIFAGKWCPECAGITIRTIEEMRALAKARGGKCLSKAYENAHTHLEWECDKGHKWKAKPSNIKSGKWCPYCRGFNKTIKDMQELAKSKGGRCLSKKYVNVNTKLKWQCAMGHSWESAPINVIHRTWCPICGRDKNQENKRLGIDEAHKWARKNQGKCLSKTYKNGHTKLRWQCRNGHVWDAGLSYIKQGYWCSKCSREKRSKV